MSTTTQYKPLPDWSEMPDWAQQRAVDLLGRLFVRAYDLQEWAQLDEGYRPVNFKHSLENRPRCQSCQCVNQLQQTADGLMCIVCIEQDNKMF